MSVRRRKGFPVYGLMFGLFSLLVGCDKGPEPVQGFVLPRGDAEIGKAVFAETGCRYCHTITDEEFEPFDATPLYEIELGGQVYKVKNYGELLTSIVNPNHSVAPRHRIKHTEENSDEPESPMPVFNDVLSVNELIDLTEYLHSRYTELAPQYRGYAYLP